MANEDSMESRQDRPPVDDEFSVRLGWGGASDDGVADRPLRVVDGPRRRAEPMRAAGVDANGDPATAIRAELAELRRALTALAEDVRGSAELQEVATGLVELRADIADLLDAEPLEQVRADIASLRDEVAKMPRPTRGGNPRAAGRSLPIPVLEPVLAELAALRTDVQALKRRTPLRADGLSERTAEEAELIARLVAQQLAARPPRPT